jgi:site-specific DNA recombinase
MYFTLLESAKRSKERKKEDEMKTAAIYCRVSTDNQEREGTSLQTQLENCLAYCQKKGYEAAHSFSEAYSGLSLERPELDRLRDLVRSNAIEVVVCHSLDRFSRDPVHGVIITQELEKHGVALETVTETIDSTEVGKLITYIRGFASKLEAEKIRERTMRGKKARAEKFGKLPSGRGVLYGYRYDKSKALNIADSCLDIVRMMGTWVLEEGIFLNEVCRRLMEKSIPAPKGGTRWSRSTVGRILRNPTYAGKTFVFRTVTVYKKVDKEVVKKRVSNPSERQLEIQNAVDRMAFNWDEWLGIQRQLDRNREMSPRNQKLHYLLRGLVFCKRDGLKYYGVPMHGKPYYRCSSHNRLLSAQHCNNRSVNAEWLDERVCKEVEGILLNPQLLLAELKKRMELNTNTTHLEEQIKLNQSRFETLDEAETRYLRLYGIGAWSQDKLMQECEKIRREQQKIQQEITELKKQTEEARELTLSIEGIKQAFQLAKGNLATFTYQEKRLALESLSIKAFVDGDSITIEGRVPMREANIVSQPV